MQAGREMDTLIGKVIGAEPRKEWNLLNNDETASVYWGETRRQVEEFLAERLKKYPDSWLKDYHVGCLEFHKSYSTDIAAAMSITDRWLSVGSGTFELNCAVIGKEKNWHCQFGNHEAADAPTAPLAICRAALKVMGVTTCHARTETPVNERYPENGTVIRRLR